MTQTMTSVVGFILVLPGGWVADYWVESRATVLMIGSLVQTSAPLINALAPTFTWVCVTTLISAFVTGISGPATTSILADCVPVDPKSGVPVAPARDYMVMAYSSIVPSIILPGLLGAVFSTFQSRAEGYRAFFLIASGIHIVSSLLYLRVGQLQKEEREKGHVAVNEGRREYTKRLAGTRFESYTRLTSDERGTPADSAKTPLLVGAE